MSYNTAAGQSMEQVCTTVEKRRVHCKKNNPVGKKRERRGALNEYRYIYTKRPKRWSLNL